jgi:hypothetical protein
MVSSEERAGRLGNGGKPNPLAGFGRVGCGAFVGGQGADAHRARTISGFAAECKQQKNIRNKSVWPAGKAGEFFGLFCWAKKRRPTLRESRPSFKEKGDKSCFTDFFNKATSVPTPGILFFH